MPLNKSLTTQEEQKLHASNLGNYQGLAHGVSHNAGLSPLSQQTSRTVNCSLSEDDFFARLDELETLNNNDGYGIGVLGPSYIVYIKGFNANSRSFKVINRTATEKISKTIKNVGGSNKVAVNGSFIDFNTYFVSPYTGPVPPAKVDTKGKSYAGGALLPNYQASPQGFSVKFAGSAFTFKQGDANGGDALGAMTPVLLYNSTHSKVWKYGGDGNKYESGATGPASGDPGPSGSKLTVRNNLQYKDQNAAALGKTIFAWHPTRDAAVFIVQKNGIAGKKLDWYRDCLYTKGFQYALGFDGSDSAILYDYKTSKMLVVAGDAKDNSLRTAVRIQS